jgi:hypothetical protein
MTGGWVGRIRYKEREMERDRHAFSLGGDEWRQRFSGGGAVVAAPRASPWHEGTPGPTHGTRRGHEWAVDGELCWRKIEERRAPTIEEILAGMGFEQMVGGAWVWEEETADQW